MSRSSIVWQDPSNFSFRKFFRKLSIKNSHPLKNEFNLVNKFGSNRESPKIVFLPINLLNALRLVFESLACMNLCYFPSLLDAIIEAPRPRILNTLLNANELEYLISELKFLRKSEKIDFHLNFDQFKTILLKETKLSAQDFDEKKSEKEKYMIDKISYSERLKRCGIFDDSDLLHTKSIQMYENRNSSIYNREFNEIKQITEKVKKPSLDILKAVDMKMQSKWVPDSFNEIQNETDEEGLREELIESRLKPLTNEELTKVQNIFSSPADGTVIIDKFNIDITRKDLHTLKTGVWLNDEIISFSMQLLQERDNLLCSLDSVRISSHYFSSFFMNKLMDCDQAGYNYNNVKRWTKKFDIFQKNKIFCPININNSHWTLLVMYISLKKIVYYDSMGRSSCSKYLNGALRYLGDEAKKLGRGFLPNEWELVPTDLINTPQQLNGYDCGVFTIMFTDFLTDNLPLDFSQEHMLLFRKKICANIIRGSLIYPERSLGSNI